MLVAAKLRCVSVVAFSLAKLVHHRDTEDTEVTQRRISITVYLPANNL